MTDLTSTFSLNCSRSSSSFVPLPSNGLFIRSATPFAASENLLPLRSCLPRSWDNFSSEGVETLDGLWDGAWESSIAEVEVESEIFWGEAADEGVFRCLRVETGSCPWRISELLGFVGNVDLVGSCIGGARENELADPYPDAISVDGSGSRELATDYVQKICLYICLDPGFGMVLSELVIFLVTSTEHLDGHPTVRTYAT
jgi:hypothetical protein